jgi:molybdopterin-binding protein
MFRRRKRSILGRQYEAIDDFALKVGDEVLAVVKASDVLVAK